MYLIRCFIGKGAAETLEREFKSHRVVYKPKRAYTISDDERARRAARARALRA